MLCYVITKNNVAVCLRDLAFVVDHSGSMVVNQMPGVDIWGEIIDFMVKIVSSVNVGQNATHVGVVSFGILHSDNSFYCYCVTFILNKNAVLSQR